MIFTGYQVLSTEGLPDTSEEWNKNNTLLLYFEA